MVRTIVASILAVALVALSAATSAGATAPTTPPTLTGLVRATDGTALAGAGVDVYTDAGESRGGAPVGSSVTAADGTWSVAAPPGRYTVFFSDRLGQRVVERWDRVVLDDFSSDLYTTLGDPARTRTVTGRVVDEGGTAVPGAEVTLLHLTDHGPGHWRFVTRAGTTTTDAEGRYELRASYGSGWMTVRAAAPGAVPTSLEGHVGPDGAAYDAGLRTEEAEVAAGDLVLAASSADTGGGPAASRTSARQVGPRAVVVRVAAPAPAAGRVTVRLRGRVVATSPVSAGSRTRVALPRLDRGRHVLSVRFSGDESTLGSVDRVAVRVTPRRR